jgi:hypothetical protein
MSCDKGKNEQQTHLPLIALVSEIGISPQIYHAEISVRQRGIPSAFQNAINSAPTTIRRPILRVAVVGSADLAGDPNK